MVTMINMEVQFVEQSWLQDLIINQETNMQKELCFVDAAVILFYLTSSSLWHNYYGH